MTGLEFVQGLADGTLPLNFAGTNVLQAPLADIALQAVVQGFLTGIVALLLYGRMVSILGATRGAAFLALTPAMTALMSIPILGEFPSAIDWIMIVVISIGVYIVSGGPLSGPDAAQAESTRQPIRCTSTASSPTDWRASSR